MEFSAYTNKQAVTRIIAEPITNTLPLVSIDTLPIGIFIITAKNDIGETVRDTINTVNYQSDDNTIDEINNTITTHNRVKIISTL